MAHQSAAHFITFDPAAHMTFGPGGDDGPTIEVRQGKASYEASGGAGVEEDALYTRLRHLRVGDEFDDYLRFLHKYVEHHHRHERRFMFLFDLSGVGTSTNPEMLRHVKHFADLHAQHTLVYQELLTCSLVLVSSPLVRDVINGLMGFVNFVARRPVHFCTDLSSPATLGFVRSSRGQRGVLSTA